MRATLRRTVALLLTSAAVGLAVTAAPAAPAQAEVVCQAGTNWDGVLKICR